MKFKHMNGKQEPLCIKVPKVYDWVVGQINLPVQSFRGTSGLERLNFTCDEIDEQVQGGQVTGIWWVRFTAPTSFKIKVLKPLGY